MGRLRCLGFVCVPALLGWLGCTVEESGDADSDAGADAGSSSDSAGQGGDTASAPSTAGKAGRGGAPSGNGGASEGGAGVGGDVEPSGGTDAEGGPPGDAGSEAGGAAGAGSSEPVAGPASVHVLLFDDTPVQGASVVFYAPDLGASVVVVTDAAGEATYDVLPGSFITVALAQTGSTTFRQLTTFFDTQPGDDLIVRDRRSPVAFGPNVGTFNVSFPTVVDAANYFIWSACDIYGGGNAATQSPAMMWIRSDCLDANGKLNSYAVAYKGSGETLGVFPMTDVLYTNGGSLTIGAWQAPTTFEVAVTPPSGVTGGAITFSPRLGSRTFVTETHYMYDALPQSRTFYPPATGVDSMITTVDMWFSPSGNWKPQTGRQTREAPSGVVQADLSALLPKIVSPAAATSAQGLPQLTWQSDAPFSDVDGGVLEAHTTFTTNAGANVEDISWTLVVPPGATSPVSPPPLPSELAAFGGRSDIPFELTGISFLASTTLGSYDAFREAFGRRFSTAREYPRAEGSQFVTRRTWAEPAN